MLIKKPVLSEKSLKLAKEGLFTFIVDQAARKNQIKDLIEKKFKVKVIGLKTIKHKAEEKTQRTRKGHFSLPAYKKALVLLKSGQKLPFFELEEAKPEEETKKQVKEKKNVLKGTKVKIERNEK